MIYPPWSNCKNPPNLVAFSPPHHDNDHTVGSIVSQKGAILGFSLPGADDALSLIILIITTVTIVKYSHSNPAAPAHHLDRHPLHQPQVH